MMDNFFKDLRDQIIAGAGLGSLSATNIALVPDNMSLKALEPLRSGPDRIRGTFRTGDLEGFLSYVDFRSLGDTVIFFDDSRLQIVACFNFGSAPAPDWQDDIAVFTAEPTWVQQKLHHLCAQPAVSRDELFGLVHDIRNENERGAAEWKVFFRDPGGETVMPEIAEQKLDGMTVESVRRVKSSKGAFERHRSAVEDMTIAASVPDTMIITAEMHRGLMLHTVEIKLDFAETIKEPALTMRIVNPHGIEEEDRNYIKHQLDDARDIGAVHIGTYAPGMKPVSATK